MEKVEPIIREIAAIKKQLRPIAWNGTPEELRARRSLLKQQRLLAFQLAQEETPERFYDKTYQARQLVRKIGIAIANNPIEFIDPDGFPIDSGDVYKELNYLTVKAKKLEKNFLQKQSDLKGLETKLAKVSQALKEAKRAV